MKKYESLQKEVIANTGRIWVRLTRACNNQCLFCLDEDAQNMSFVSTSDILTQLKQGIVEKTTRAVLSGGEPTIHPDFIHIVKETKKTGYEHIQVITNGRMFSYSNFLRQALAAGLKEITFSFHGHRAQMHDELTQTEGSFEQSLKGLKNALNLKHSGLIISVDIVVNKLNVSFLKEIILFFTRLGVTEFDLLQIMPFGRAWKQRKKLFYNFEKHRHNLRRAFDLSRTQQLYIWTNRFPPQCLEGYEFLIQDPHKLYDEIGGRKPMFENFLRKGITMPCKGDRCGFCFLERFCKDLGELRLKKYLAAYQTAYCIKTESPQTIRFIKKTDTDVFNFLDFFIKHRYFLKSGACRGCRVFHQCHGMSCGYIKENGFQSLKPLT